MLTVKSLSHKDSNWRRYYECLCSCGNTKVIHGAALTSGNTRSCGCLARVAASRRALPEDGGVINQIILQYKRHAKTRGFNFLLTTEEVSAIVRGPCFYCGEASGNTKKTKNCKDGFRHNGIDRVDSSMHYAADNVVSCCAICNRAKRDMAQSEFIAWAKRVAMHRTQWPTSGEALAYSQGLKAGEIADIKSNPQFSNYCERIAYRAGWLTAMKNKPANAEITGACLQASELIDWLCSIWRKDEQGFYHR